jgi:hypothetical protein
LTVHTDAGVGGKVGAAVAVGSSVSVGAGVGEGPALSASEGAEVAIGGWVGKGVGVSVETNAMTVAGEQPASKRKANKNRIILFILFSCNAIDQNLTVAR